MDRPTRTAIARVLEALLWSAAALGVWLLSLAAVSSEELIVACLASVLCGPIAVVGRLVARHSWRLDPRWLRPALVFPLVVVTDTVAAFASLVTRRRGRFVRVGVTGGAGGGPWQTGRRVAAEFFATLTPGSYVIDIDPDTGEAIVHELDSIGPSMRRLASK